MEEMTNNDNINDTNEMTTIMTILQRVLSRIMGQRVVCTGPEPTAPNTYRK